MAFGGFESGQQAGRPGRPMSEINVTPLVDVMLVLVVIFILTAPLLASSIRLDLPKAGNANAAPAPTAAHVLLVLDRSGQAFLDDQPVSLAELARRLAAAAAIDPGTELHLRADEAAPYGRVAEVLGAAQKAGLDRIGFVTEAATPAEPAPAAAPTGKR